VTKVQCRARPAPVASDRVSELISGSNLSAVPLVSIVDDDPSVRRALQRLIEAAGYTVETFGSGEAFLDATPWGRSACLIIDIHMVGMTGLELQERLLARGSAAPVIFITANDDAPTRERIGQSGAAAYLPKPFDRRTLIGAIRGAIGLPD
jgi:FixJ family two-component response regulator